MFFSVRMTVPLLRLDGMLTWIGRLLNLMVSGMCGTVVVCLCDYFDTFVVDSAGGSSALNERFSSHLISSHLKTVEQVNRRIVELVRSFAPFVSHALGAPLRPGESHRFPCAVWSQLCLWRRLDPNLAFCFPLGSEVTGGRSRCNLR